MYKIINKKKLLATMVADIIGNIIFFRKLLSKKSEEIKPGNIKEILIIRTAYIGDVVMTMPMLKPLKELYPMSRITFLTCAGAKDLFKGCPYVDAVIAYDAFWFYPGRIKSYLSFLKEFRKKRYDLVIEARADIRDILFVMYLVKSKYRVSYRVGGGGFLLTHVVPFERIKHRVSYHLDIIRFLGGIRIGLDWGIRLSDKEIDKAKEIFMGETVLKVGINPGGRKGLKCWAPERYAALARRLVTECRAEVFFTGSPAEDGLIDSIIKDSGEAAYNLAGKTELKTLAALIARFNLFVTNDSAPLHLASAMKTPTVAIFGPSKSNETGPYGNIHRVVEKDFPCRQTCDEDVCKHVPFKECMEVITVEDVLNAVKEVLEECRRRQHDVQA